MQPTQQDVQTLHGVIMAIAEGRKGPAHGGVLDGARGRHAARAPAEHGPRGVSPSAGRCAACRGCLRRNPTDAERTLWKALTRDRRFAGHGFKRQVPVGPHITDMVSFALRAVIDIVPGEESEAGAKARADKAPGSATRGYRVLPVRVAEIEADAGKVLDGLEAAISSS